jgi:hypothetical protein
VAGSLGEPAVAPPLSSLSLDRLSFAARACQTTLMRASSLPARRHAALRQTHLPRPRLVTILLRDMSSRAAQELRCPRDSNCKRGHVQPSGQGMATRGICPLVRTSGGHTARSDPAARHMSSGASRAGACPVVGSRGGTCPLVRVRAGHPRAGVRAGQVRKPVKRVNQRGREGQGKLPSSPGSVRRPPHAWLLDFRPR